MYVYDGVSSKNEESCSVLKVLMLTYNLEYVIFLYVYD